MDETDLAQGFEQMHRDHALEAVRGRQDSAETGVGDGGAARECLGCGDDIPAGRLRVLPGATHCAECQSELEG